jgi:hypothetical protein
MQADCIQQVGTQVISKSVGSNTLQCCDAQSGKMQRQIDIAADTTSTSGFDVSIDQRLLCVGTTTGLVAVIEVQSGKCIATLEHKRVRQSVNACVFSADVRYVVACNERERESMMLATTTNNWLTMTQEHLLCNNKSTLVEMGHLSKYIMSSVIVIVVVGTGGV